METKVYDLSVGITADTKQFEDAIEDTKGKAENAGTSIGSIFGKAFRALGTIVALGGLTRAVTNLGKQVVDSYANYEQLVGGVDTLFGEASKKVQEYADRAYETVGVSANTYMETATSFSASLLKSLGNDVDLAAEVTDRALTDMADNANKMGTAFGSVQHAYLGFSKQNYMMLDNLNILGALAV